jgi:hypothetical protein
VGEISFDLGDVVPLTVEIRDATGALANEGAITLAITLPDGTTAAGTTPTNPSVGVYQYDYLTTQVGRHTVRWVATGTNASAYTDSFDVRPAQPDYIISLADAKAQENIDSTVADEELRPFVEATTAIVERETGKTIVRRPVTNELHQLSYGKTSLFLRQRPVISVTSIASLDGLTTWSPSNWYVNGDWGQLLWKSGPYLYGDVLVGYVPGMAVIPANYTRAAAIIIQHLWETQRGTMGSRRFGGQELDRSLVGMGYAIPNRAKELLGPRAPVVA